MDLRGTEAVSGRLVNQAQRTLDQVPQRVHEFETVLQALQEKGRNPNEILRQTTAAHSTVDLSPAGVDGQLYAHKLHEAQQPGGLEQLLDEVQTGYQRLNHLVEEFQGGRAFSTGELLGLQAEMQQVTMEVEVTTKVISELVSNVRQLMHQQL